MDGFYFKIFMVVPSGFEQRPKEVGLAVFKQVAK